MFGAVVAVAGGFRRGAFLFRVGIVEFPESSLFLAWAVAARRFGLAVSGVAGSIGLKS